METRLIEGVLSKLHVDGVTWVREDKDRVCLQGHELTGQEKRDCTRTLRCTECAKARRKTYEMQPRGTQAGKYRRSMRDVKPEDEHMSEPWS